MFSEVIQNQFGTNEEFFEQFFAKEYERARARNSTVLWMEYPRNFSKDIVFAWVQKKCEGKFEVCHGWLPGGSCIVLGDSATQKSLEMSMRNFLPSLFTTVNPPDQRTMEDLQKRISSTQKDMVRAPTSIFLGSPMSNPPMALGCSISPPDGAAGPCGPPVLRDSIFKN